MNALARLIPDFDAPVGFPPAANAELVSFEIPGPADTGPAPEEIEARAREEARAEAEAEFERLRAEDRARFEAELAETRQGWVAGEGDRLAARIAESIADLEERISDTAARAIGPFLVEPVRKRALDELGGTIAGLLADARHPHLAVTGPADLLDEIAARLGERAAAVTFSPADTSDVRVTADTTVIETQLAAWLSRLASAVR